MDRFVSTSFGDETVMKALANLQELKIVHEITGCHRGRLFAYSRYMSILNRGTEALND